MLLLTATLLTASAGTSPFETSALLAELETAGASAGFLSALEESGMAEELGGRGPLTFLAPTDAAFGELPPETIARLFRPESRQALRQILSMHVLACPMEAIELLGRDVPTLAGAPVTAAFEGGILTIGGAPVKSNDLRAAGSVVHLVSKVIMPPVDPVAAAADRIARRALDIGADLAPGVRTSIHELALGSILELDPSSRLAFNALFSSGEGAQGLTDALNSYVIEPMTNSTAPGPDARVLVNFDGSGAGPDWYVLNDDVMGGISNSSFGTSEDGVALFEGQLSLENNGGFASVRTGRNEYDLQDAKGLRIRVRGDGREYALSAVCTDGRGRTGSWRKRFVAPAGEWAVIDVPFGEMVLNIRGRRFPDVGPPKRDAISGFSILIGDKNTDPFRLEMDWIAAYR